MLDLKRDKLNPPKEGKVLLHSCCAPCSGELMEAMTESGIDYSIFFYNPNIHPKKEYEIRKNENIRYAKELNIPFIDADYDVDNWFERTKGMEWDPERGRRCSTCFDMRFERTALYAAENGFSTITSSLGLSRWKDMNQINESGIILCRLMVLNVCIKSLNVKIFTSKNIVVVFIRYEIQINGVHKMIVKKLK